MESTLSCAQKNNFVFHSKKKKLSTEVSHILPTSTPHTAFSTINILHPSGTLVTINEPTLTHHYYSKPTVYIGFTLGVVHTVGLDKHYNMVVSHRVAALP